jgi:transposase-like protein
LKKRRSFTDEQKKAILQYAIDNGSVSKTLEKYRLADGAFYRWQKRFMPNWETVFKPKMNTRRHSEVSRPRVERIVRPTGLVDLVRSQLRTAQNDVKRLSRVLVLLVGRKRG